MGKLNVKVLSPEAELASSEAIEVSVPAYFGYMGLRPAHAPIISEIGMGTLELKHDSQRSSKYFVSGGYFELLDDELTLLVDVIEKSEEIDLARAGRSVERAIERLNTKTGVDLDIARSLASLEKAKARKRLGELHQ